MIKEKKQGVDKKNWGSYYDKEAYVHNMQQASTPRHN